MKIAFEIAVRSVSISLLALLFDIVSDKIMLSRFAEFSIYLDRFAIAFIAVVMTMMIYYKPERT